MPFTGSYSDFEHVLMHEMAHQFQYDIWSRGRAGAGFATLVAIAPPLWFAEGMAEYLSTGPINAETAMWLRDASLEREAAHHRSDDGGPVRVLPLPLRPRALVLRRRALGRRGRRRHPQGDACGRGRAGLPAHHRPHPRPAVGAVARRGAEAVSAGDRRAGARSRRGRRAAHREAVGRHPPPGPRPLARRLAGGLLQREGLLLRGYVPRRRRHRRGQAADPEVGHQQQLRDVPVHQLAGELVARRQVPRLRGQARPERRHPHRGRRPQQRGEAHRARS